MIKLEQRRASYFADFIVYPVAILTGLVLLVLYADSSPAGLILSAMAGFLAWTLIEYALHRFLFHHVQPFEGWHDEHHRRPRALIGTPTVVSLALFVVLGFLPLRFLLGPWFALAAILGLASGYLLYVIVHHGVHHWHTRPGSWMRARQQEHARHHMKGATGWYGVITPFWDKVFSTDKP